MFGNNSSVFSKIIKENLTNRAFFFILPSWIFTLACYNLHVPKKRERKFFKSPGRDKNHGHNFPHNQNSGHGTGKEWYYI